MMISALSNFGHCMWKLEKCSKYMRNRCSNVKTRNGFMFPVSTHNLDKDHDLLSSRKNKPNTVQKTPGGYFPLLKIFSSGDGVIMCK